MNNKEYRLCQMKWQLKNLKRKGVIKVEWKLNPEQLDFVTNVLNYRTEPYLYEIKTRTISRYTLSSASSILKDVHYNCKSGHSKIVRKINKKDRELLSQYGVKYTPFKYTIYLI